MGTLALVMKWEAACTLCPLLALEDHCVGLEGDTWVLALEKMQWPLHADLVSACQQPGRYSLLGAGLYALPLSPSLYVC